jgi:ABC-type oligopeptide transport system substrate-binding subunit
MTVTATDGLTTKTLVVAALTIALDAVANVASGTGPAGATVDVSINTPGGPHQQVTIPESGNWSVNFSPFDVKLGMGASVSLSDADFDRSQADVFLPLPTVSGHLSDGGISLQNWTANSDVTVTVVGHPSLPPVHIGPNGFAYIDKNTVGTTLAPGTQITATDGITTKDVTLVAVSINVPTVGTSIVSGHAPAGMNVGVNVTAADGSFLAHRDVVANADSFWSADFTGAVTFTNGMSIGASAFDSDRDETFVQTSLAPDTTITSDPTPLASGDGTSFSFSSDTAGAQFECALDESSFQPCSSPKVVYTTSGLHTFSVRATFHGATDPTPALSTWTATVARVSDTAYRIDTPRAFDSLDTGRAFTTRSWQILYATCAKLYNYPDQPVPGALQLVPEVATAMPTVSADGLTYTITLNNTFKFAGEAKEPVTAQSFADAIKRALSPGNTSGAADFVMDIEGAAAYHAGTSYTLGVTAVGNVLTIHLTSPHADLPQRLAMPFFCPVPSGTPLGSEVATEPGSGPYTIGSASDSRVVLKLNPNYTGLRPSPYDEIDVNIGVDQAIGQARVLAGDSDYLQGGPAPEQTTSLQELHPSQFFTNPSLVTRYVGFNLARPGTPFANPNLRRAVSLVLNRNALAAAMPPGTSVPTDQLLPPGLPGFQDALLTPAAGDVTQALSFAALANVSPTSRITVALYTCTSAACTATAQVIKDNLALIGIDVDIRAFPRGVQLAKEMTVGEPFDLYWEGWGADYADGSDFFDALLKTGSGSNFGGYTDASTEARIAEADAAPIPARYTLWANLDKDLFSNPAGSLGSTPMAPVLNSITSDLFSARMGCQIYNPIYGMDLAALCGNVSSATVDLLQSTDSTEAGAAQVPISNIPLTALSGAKTGTSQSAPLDTVPLDTVPLDTVDLAHSPLDTVPLDTVGLNAANLVQNALGGVLLSSIPLIPPATWESTLSSTTLGGVPINTLTLADVARSAPGVLHNLTLGGVNLRSSPLDTVGLGAIALGALPLDTVPILGHTDVATNEADWCALIRTAPGLGDFPCATVATQTVLGITLAGAPLDTVPLDTVPLDTVNLHGTPLDTVPLDTVDLANSPLDTVPLDTVDMTRSPLDTVPLNLLNNPGAVADCNLVTCTTATIGDAVAAHALKPGATLEDVRPFPGLTLGNIGKGMPPSVTLHAVLSLLLGRPAYDWSALPASFPLQDFATAGGSVTYTAHFTLAGAGARSSSTVTVKLSGGTRYVPQTATITPTLTPAEPTVTEASGVETLKWRLKGVAIGTTYTIRLSARPGLQLGTAQADATIAAGGAAVGSSGIAVLNIHDTLEPNDNANVPTPVTTDTLYSSYITSATDKDYFTIPIPAAGTQTKIFLQHLPADYDVVVYGPQGQALRASPLDTVPLDTVSVGDPNATLQQRSQSISPETLRDIPNTPPTGATMIGSSDTRGTSDEEVDLISTGQAGNYTIQITGFNGAFSDKPYLLRVSQQNAFPLPQCQPRTMGSGGTAGAMPAVPAGVNTLFLVNEKQLGDLHGAAAESSVVAALNSIAGDSADGVIGMVVPVESSIGVQSAYTAWNADPCAPEKANDVVRAIGSVIDTIRNGRNTIKNVVLVGGDDVTPMGRVPDSGSQANEIGYASTFGFQTNNQFVSAYANHYLMSDDPYGDTNPVSFLGQTLYVPEWAIGRLVDTPTQIVGEINQFLNAHGALNPQTELTTGYDFLSDGATAVSSALRAPGRKTNGDLINNTWNATALESGIFPATSPPAIMSLNAHYDHNRLLPADQNAAHTQTALYTAAMLASRGANAVANRIIMTMGCHSGVMTPFSLFGSSGLGVNWADTYLNGGAVGFMGNTGYGLGDTVAVAYSEALNQNFAKNLDGSLSLGAALTYAKQQYYGGLGTVTSYDEKVINEATLYGLPMWRLGTTAPPAPPASPPTFTDGATGLTATTIGIDNPPFQRNDTVGYGSYYSINGQFEAVNRRPIEPATTFDVTEPNLTPHGFLFTELAQQPDFNIDAAFSRTVTDSQIAEPELVGLVNFPTQLGALRVISSPNGQRNLLVTALGQYRTDNAPDLAGTGVQRLYTHLAGRVFYSASRDFTPPSLAAVSLARLGGNVAVSLNVTDVDPTGATPSVKRVLFLYRDGATWRSFDLGHDGDRWSGVGPLNASTTDYFIQAVDANGNVAETADKGAVGEPVVAHQQGGSVHGSTSGNSTGGFYTGPVTVSLAGGNGVSIETSTDGGAYQPYSAPFTVTVDGAHDVAFRGSDGSTGDVIFVIDTTPPKITTGVRSYAVGSTGAAFDYACADAGSGLASCVVTSPASGVPDTSTGGVKTFHVHAVDRVGNVGDADGTYSVVWPFKGFFSPIGNVPVFNQANAGQAIPTKFSLGGNRGLAIFDTGYPKSEQISCDSSAPIGALVATTTAGASSVSYDAGADQYNYVWKTDKVWANTCRALVVRLADGTEHTANFRLK